MNAQETIDLLNSVGAAAIFLALVQAGIKWVSGASHRERVKNTDIVTQRLEAIQERDKAEDELELETRRRREAEEHVSILKRQLLVNGITPKERINK